MLLKGLNLGPHKYEFSSLAVSLSLEGKASHRELTSRLLSDLSGKLLSQSDMARAFDKMLKELPDLILDTPEAPQVDTLCSQSHIYLFKWIWVVCIRGSNFIAKFRTKCASSDRLLKLLLKNILLSFTISTFLWYCCKHWTWCGDKSCCKICLRLVFQMLGQFIARAIADHILPMSFLDCYKGKVDCEHARWTKTSKIKMHLQ